MAYVKELLISLITEQDNRHNPYYTSVVNVRCIYRYIPIYTLLLVNFFSLLLLLLHTSHFEFVLALYNDSDALWFHLLLPTQQHDVQLPTYSICQTTEKCNLVKTPSVPEKLLS